ncbi:MAG: FAD binding domain-containing protein [Desulfobacterota bacterium]|jgi:CO/xanthine dehydrogenase FAD-binding subunit|nr:FAD binding domain-containing protein [Thermodesulfobacteriota bacterium]
MKPSYLAPLTLEEALEHLNRRGETVRVLAGGTDLMVEIRAARLKGNTVPPALLDVSAIPELREIRMEAGHLHLGAAVTFHTLEHDPLIKKMVPVLSAAAAQMGSVQVRRLATIGGNVGTASPAGDGITPLTALDAEVKVVSRDKSRVLPLTDLITGPGRTGLAANELIHSFSLAFPAAPERCFFSKIMRRRAVAIARMNLAVQIRLVDSGMIQSSRIAAGAVFPTPRRLMEVEGLLIGQLPGKELFQACGRRAVEAMRVVSGRRPSMAYKEPALERLVVQGLEQTCGV